ncbi:MAG: hypothetical protein ACI3V2_08415 [Faecousia sp.]
MKKRTHVFLSLLLICISAGLLGLLLSDMRHNAKSAADRLAREELDIDVAIFAKQDIPERLVPGLLDPSSEGENLIYRFDGDEQYQLNRFLTYFSEQLVIYYHPADSNAMIDFAYRFLRGNFEELAADGLLDQVESVNDREGRRYVLPSSVIDLITKRFFGKTVRHNTDTYEFKREYEDEYPFLDLLDVATAVYANGDDTYTVEFDTYRYPVEQFLPCPFREDDLLDAERRSDWTPEDSRLVSFYAESLKTDFRWEYIGTTSGAISPNPYLYLGYDIYSVEYNTPTRDGETCLYLVPYGGSAPAPVLYVYDETDHTMRPVTNSGSLISEDYLTLSAPSARVHPELQYLRSGTAVVRSYGESYQLFFYDDGSVINRPLISVDDDLRYRLSRFISYFTEQSFGPYNADDTGNTDDTDILLHFAYSYLIINEPDVLEPAQDGTSRMLLRAEDADRVLYRFFGKTVEHTEDIYYFPMPDDERNAVFSTVGLVSDNGDGTYRIDFTNWTLYSEEYHYNTVPDVYYSLSNATLFDDYGVGYGGGGTAVIRECTDGENTTYQLISFSMQ